MAVTVSVFLCAEAAGVQASQHRSRGGRSARGGGAVAGHASRGAQCTFFFFFSYGLLQEGLEPLPSGLRGISCRIVAHLSSVSSGMIARMEVYESKAEKKFLRILCSYM